MVSVDHFAALKSFLVALISGHFEALIRLKVRVSLIRFRQIKSYKTNGYAIGYFQGFMRGSIVEALGTISGPRHWIAVTLESLPQASKR